ncbi:hypothetical protein C8R43DRAFT_1013465 [Mycena crocata]|nr:hypothetical protein C8R43DRAFT_1013465 [Mycena crocata]
MAQLSPLATAQAFLDAITTGNIEGMAPLMTDGFTWRLLPAALCVPAKNKRQYLLQTARLRELIISLEVGAPLDLVETTDAVVVHVQIGGVLATGAPYQNESVMIFHCEGGRIHRMMEFMDSEYMRGVLEAGDGVGFKLLRQTYDEV